jgi:glycosyltransferase involved in cell wall biosynthesis
MLISAVIISRNEAPRLKLVLESFANQDLRADQGRLAVELEVVVVDDGSTDETATVLTSFEDRLALRVITHAPSRGRSPSRNAGVRAAAGEVVVLFDGDCLAAPNLVARHAEVHAARPDVMGRGESYHLRSTRFFRDPSNGEPMPGAEGHVRRMGEQLHNALITTEQVRDRFETLVARAEPGIYAGAGPGRLYQLEMHALHAIPDASILWMTAPGQNFSLRRAHFLEVGGFDERLSLNEHRELAFRLYQRGKKMVPIDGARSFHMLHRVGWRDPLADSDWERLFFQMHPCLATKLMSVFWLGLAQDKDLPDEARITTFEHLESVVKNGTTFDYDSLRRTHPRLIELEGHVASAC